METEVTVTYRDKRGGHDLGDVTHGSRGVTCWTKKGRKFIKKLNRREMRREAKRIEAEALREYEEETRLNWREQLLYDLYEDWHVLEDDYEPLYSQEDLDEEYGDTHFEDTSYFYESSYSFGDDHYI